MTAINYAQNINIEQVSEQFKYFTNYIDIPIEYSLISIKQGRADEKDVYIFRYEKSENSKIGGEHFSFIVTKSKPYRILGFTTMDAKYSEKNQLNKEQVEKISADFLNKIDASFFNELELQWIDIHTEEINVDGKQRIISGMKCKYYRPSHKDYAWVIVGYDGSIITFERDILWSNGMQRRITEKWLHDSWIRENGTEQNEIKKEKKIESTAFLRCKEGKVEEFKIAVSELIAETVKEAGCELFRIFQNNEEPDEFILWEIFENQKALDIHMNSPHTQKCFALDLFELVSITHQTEVM